MEGHWRPEEEGTEMGLGVRARARQRGRARAEEGAGEE